MKDKLYKNNHKGSYYKAKYCAIGLACFLFLSVSIAVPTYVSSHVEVKDTHAETSEKLVKIDSNCKFLSY